MTRQHGSALVFSIALLGALVSGCAREQPRLAIRDPRVEFSDVMRDEAAVYLKVRNEGGPDTLLAAGVSIPAAVATIHVMRGDIMVIGRSLPVPARSSVDLSRIGPHIMLTKLPPDTAVGTKFMLTLRFERSGEVQVPLEFTKGRPDPTGRPHVHQH